MEERFSHFRQLAFSLSKKILDLPRVKGIIVWKRREWIKEKTRKIWKKRKEDEVNREKKDQDDYLNC